MSPSSRIPLIGAVVATPLFVILWAIQAATRDGFRPLFQPMSLLSLSDGGWVQIGNFVATGILFIAGGVALTRTLPGGRLPRWIGALIAVIGIGLVIAGAFATDAGAGFPAGAPEGAPEMSWHGALHQVGFILTQLAFVAASILLAVRFGRDRQRGWMVTSIAAVAAAVLVVGLGDTETLAIRLVISSAIELGLISAVALGVLRAAAGHPERTGVASEFAREG